MDHQDYCMVCDSEIPPGPDRCSIECEEVLNSSQSTGSTPCIECGQVGFHKMSCDTRTFGTLVPGTKGDSARS